MQKTVRELSRIGRAIVIGIAVCGTISVAEAQPTATTPSDRSKLPDSYRYYGPNGLWKLWERDDWQPHRVGRDTWIHWTWGNQKFLRYGAKGLSNQPIPISLDLYRLLDSRHRATRFTQLGLINEPNCRPATAAERKHGLWLDIWEGDPEHYYPTDEQYARRQHYPGTQEQVTTNHYGRPSGILGLRLFDNPKFNPQKWDLEQYFAAPGAMEPPYLVGFTCALCHIAFDPTNPPVDPNRPRWENLAANIGNQYLKEGDLIFTKGRVLFGDRNPGPKRSSDPYDTAGLGPDEFLYHYASTQQPGTSETSRISYDFINNPNTINAIFNLKHRPQFREINPQGKPVSTMHILKDGADSVGVEWALMRVPINIGCEGVYWSGSLFNPFTGASQQPFRITEALWRLPDSEKQKLHDTYGLDFSAVTPARIAEIQARYRDDFGEEFGLDWAEAWKRNGSLATYLMSYRPFHLQDAPGGAAHLTKDAEQLKRGKLLFADHCARCHSNKQPAPDATAEARRQFYRDSVLSADFLTDNTLSDDVRYSTNELGTNMARALATNAVGDDVWAQFSSTDYKILPGLSQNSSLRLHVPVFPGQPPIQVDFEAPAGGRGYYRTPSLVSLWATAPYLHNNALGKYTGQVSVAARLDEFQDGITKLLWPEKREMTVKRTDRPTNLAPGLLHALPALLAHRLEGVLEEIVRDKLPRNLADAAVRDFKPAVDAAIGAVLKKLSRLDPADVQAELAALVDREVRNLGTKLEIPDNLVTALQTALRTRLQQDMDMVKAVAGLNKLQVPAGTPVNLYLNLPLSKLPYAILAHVAQRPGSREWAEALLKLSACPDLVEDHGHTYGAKEMTDAEKRDLIEFLKTF